MRLVVGLGVLAVIASGCGGSSATKTVTATITQRVTVTAPTSGTVPVKSTTDASTTTTSNDTAKLVIPHSLVGNTAHLPRGATGKLSVVKTGAFRQGSIPIIIFNGTDAPVARVKVTATARKNGALVASGESQDMSPNFAATNGYVIGYVYFSGAKPPAGSTIAFNVTATNLSDDDFETTRDMTPTEQHVLKGSYGELNLVGSMKNTNADVVSGPIHVQVICLDKGGEILNEANGFTDDDKAAPGATVSYTVTIGSHQTCPVPLVAGGGYNF